MASKRLIEEIVGLFDYFDIEKYLESRGVEYWTEGKNVTRGWININCLWCQDPSNHLGINLDTKKLSCWICSQKGTIIKLIMKIDNCSLRKVLTIVKEFSSVRPKGRKYEHLRERETTVKLPVLAKRELYPLHRKFLEKRGFDPEYIFDKYNLYCNGPIGKYKHRLIIPFYKHKTLVTFSARDVTDKAKIPYTNYPKEKSILSTKETLYNINNCGDTALVVEGIIDVWKIGDGSCATMGTKWTVEQLQNLYQLKRVFILFDTEEEAQRNADSLYEHLRCAVPYVERVILDSGDPGDMNKEEAKQLRKEIFGKVY